MDALYFIRLALEEYHPELFELLMATLGESLTKDEWEVVRAYRAAAQAERSVNRHLKVTPDRRRKLTPLSV